MLHSLFILFAVVRGQFLSVEDNFEDYFENNFEDCFDEIKCSEDLEFIIPNQKCPKFFVPEMSKIFQPVTIRMSKNQLRWILF